MNDMQTMAALYEGLDWGKTALGNRDSWPPLLSILLRNLLSCPLPACLCWGKDRVFLYNDAMSFILADRHPHALGLALEKVFPEHWLRFEGIFAAVALGRNFLIEDWKIGVLSCNASVSPVYGAESEPIAAQCILQNPTEGKTQDMEGGLEEAPAAISFWEGPEHIYIYANRYLRKRILFDRPIMGLPMREVVPELHGQWPFDVLDQVYQTGEIKVFENEKLWIKNESGELQSRYFNFSCFARRDTKGKIIGTASICLDITQEVEARQLLDQKRRELVQLANSMPLMVWSASVYGEADYFNDRWYRYTGLSMKQSEGWKWLQAFHPDDALRFIEYWKEGQSQEIGILMQARIMNAETFEYRWFQIDMAPLKDGQGQVIKWFGSTTDIHELRMLTDRLTEAKSRFVQEKNNFEAIFTSAASPLALCRGPRHEIIKANSSFQTIFEKRSLILQLLEIAIPEMKDVGLLEKVDTVFATGEPYHDKELAMTLNGSVAYFDVTFTLIRSVHSWNRDGVLIELIDVTDKVLSRQKIEANEKWLRVSTEAARIGLWALNRDSRRATLSERAAEFLEVKGKHEIGLDDLFQHVPVEEMNRIIEETRKAFERKESQPLDFTYRYVLKDGSIRWLRSFGQVQADGSREPREMMGSLIDVTEQMRTQDELIAAREAAEQASLSKSFFLANMSHEIRTPLSAIIGFVELLKNPESAALQKANYLEVIERNTQQLLRIIDDILDLSKVEAGKMLIETIRFSLIVLLNDLISTMQFRSRESGIQFVVETETSLPDFVLSDPTRMRQILNNVVGNAFKFTEHGQVRLRVAYRNSMLRFTVIDTGIGISPEQRERLFHAFSQADASTSRNFGGTGLGLVLTKKLSEAMGGDFRLIRSEVGHGSVFSARVRVALPADVTMTRDLDTNQPQRVGATASQEQDLLGVNVLVVDDSADNLFLLSEILHKFGAHVELADDGLEGVNRALTGNFDVVLMDVQMPRMDGYEAVRHLRSRNFQQPIIALTAHAMREVQERCLQAGYTDFLSKPIDRKKLLDMVKTSRSRDERRNPDADLEQPILLGR